MSLTIFGDLHLGYERKSFTTKEGRTRFKKMIFDVAMSNLEGAKGTLIQVGDLFDKPSNTDSIMLQGLRVNEKFDWLLAGNHDLRNKYGFDSTLHMLKEPFEPSPQSIVFPVYNKPRACVAPVAGAILPVMVPYCYSQELFEQSLELAIQKVSGDESPFKVLLLHTNYNLEFDLTETTNNLTAKMAKKLLKTFDYIFSGHEHNTATHLNGKLIMVGSLFPLSITDLEDKFAFHINDSGQITRTRTWDKELQSKIYTVAEMPDILPAEVQFVRITGELTTEALPHAMKKVAEWWQGSESLFVCKPEWKVTSEDDKGREVTISSIDSIPNTIRSLISDPELVEMYDQLLKEAEG